MKHNSTNVQDLPRSRSTQVGRQRQSVDVEKANGRLLELLDTMMRERWLPIGLRTMVVQELPVLRRMISVNRPDETAILSVLEYIVDAADEYGGEVSKSRTSNLLRCLAYEFRVHQGQSAA